MWTHDARARPGTPATRLWLGPAGLIVALVAALWQAWRLRFILDDAFISFRYADNLARGLGLVWNEGERVEGYTNFLWTVVLAIPRAVGHDVEAFAIVLGMALFATTLTIFFWLAGTLTRSWGAATLATITLGVFPSFAAFATGGLETQLQACLLTGLLALVMHAIGQERSSSPAAAAIGVVAALAVLTRMDSVLIAGPLLGLYASSATGRHGRMGVVLSARAFGIPLVVCGVWLAWKLAYYGAVLPNTFAAKVEGAATLPRRGLRFVMTFIQAYAFYLPVAVVPVGAWLARDHRLDRGLFVWMTGMLGAWVAYIVLVGGDFMEYRVLMPVLPLWCLLTYWVVCEYDRTQVRAALLVSLVVGGGAWAYGSEKVPKPVGSPIPRSLLAVTADQEWREIGTVLGRSFGGAVRPTIAVVPAGVIPYLSRLPAVDMLGLNDREVRSFTELPYELVGHRRLAPLGLLERRRVNLLIGFPVVRSRLAPGVPVRYEEFSHRPYAFPDDQRLRGRRLIEMPLSLNRVLLIVYLTEEPAVTARLGELGWRRYTLE